MLDANTEAGPETAWALVVTDPDPCYTRASDHVVQHLSKGAFDRVQTVPANRMVAALQELVRKAASGPQLPFDQLLVVGPRVFGPLGRGAQALLATASGRPAFALAAPDRGVDPVRTEVPVMVLSGELVRSFEFAAALATLSVDASAVDLQRALGVQGVQVSTWCPPPRDGMEDHYFLRDDLIAAVASEVPFLPWSVFTQNPLALERWAITPSSALDFVLPAYPSDLFWDTLVHAAPSRTWLTNCALRDVVMGRGAEPAASATDLRTAVIVHAFHVQMLEELLTLAARVPPPVDLFVTTDTAEKCEKIQAMLAEWTLPFEFSEVRVVAENRGRDIAALVLDCADVVRDPQYDLILKLHTKGVSRGPEATGMAFREYLLRNLLGSNELVDHIYRRFQDEPQLGLVFPPPYAMGTEVLGDGWTANRTPAESLRARLGIDVPFDETTPVAPYGSMYFARRQAVLPLVEAGFRRDDFPAESATGRLNGGFGEYRDGSLAHVLERVVAYAAYARGFYARESLTAAGAAESSVALQYRLDAVSRHLHPHAINAQQMLRVSPLVALRGGKAITRMRNQLRRRAPRLASALGRVRDSVMPGGRG